MARRKLSDEELEMYADGRWSMTHTHTHIHPPPHTHSCLTRYEHANVWLVERTGSTPTSVVWLKQDA